jgi:hypothetical protein
MGSRDRPVAALERVEAILDNRAIYELAAFVPDADLWVPKTRPGMLSRRFARRDRISRGAGRPSRERECS